MFKKRSESDQHPPSPDHLDDSAQPSAEPSNLRQTLGLDMPTASVVVSSYDESKAQQRTRILKVALLVLGLLAVVGVVVYFLVGPGKPVLERTLSAVNTQNAAGASLPTFTPQPTRTATHTAVPSSTPVPTATPLPSATATPKPSQTRLPATWTLTTDASQVVTTTMAAVLTDTVTPTPSPEPNLSGCMSALDVTLEHVGQTLCVRGTILRLVKDGTTTLIVFSDEKGAFYFISYGINWKDAVVGKCVQATGVIKQILKNPVIVLDNKAPLEACK